MMFVWFHPVHKKYRIGDQRCYQTDCQEAGKKTLDILYELNQTVMPLADKIIQQLSSGQMIKTA